MSDRAFIDTNILVYLFSSNEPEKNKIALNLINSDSEFVISTQVVNEFINVMNKKIKAELITITKAVDILPSHFTIVEISLNTIKSALIIAHKHKYRYFDALMLASALENGIPILYSEDMHNTHLINNKLRIINPFK